MNQALTKKMLLELTVAERLALLEATWASLEQAPEQVVVPDWHRTELDRRLDASNEQIAPAKSWDEVKQAILTSLRK